MRGLEMAKSEEAVYEVVRQAMGEEIPEHPAELLVADSSRAHFRRVLTVGDPPPGCDVMAPLDCPATTRGQATLFADDTSIDTCPHLRGRGCSATCVPVSVAGKTSGVVHLTGPLGEPPRGEVLVTLETVARRASERIAMVRAFEQTTAQARSDVLTGLPNRRALEEHLRDQQRSGDPYALAFCDLDRFKQLNDVHGHATGDRALRLFARVLRDAVRPSDLPSRYGGEEFVLLLPDCSADEAEVVLERVREQLVLALASGTVPSFTCSFGLATSNDAADPEAVIAAADEALLAAKAAGRNRIVRVDRPLSVSELATAPPAR
jgi:diguanylate cyclase (GGDEF)-like protein